MPNRTRTRWWGKFTLVALVSALVGAAAAWAILTILRPPSDPLGVTDATFVAVTEGSVGDAIILNANAEWTPQPIGINRATGVVTEVRLDPGSQAQAGTVLYTVDLRPVVVAQGSIPAFRDIGAGAQGADVAQLQQFLTATGFYDGDADGTAGAATVAAIRAWQTDLGVAANGVVGVGDIVFVPKLPVRATLDAKLVSRGATLNGGEAVLQGIPDTPAFFIPLTKQQVANIKPGTAVSVSSPKGGTWNAIAGEARSDPQSELINLTLDGANGGSVCGTECDQVPAPGGSSLRVQVISVPQTKGLVVPTSALVTDATGNTAVIDRDGKRLPVTVGTSAKGMSIITGVDAGTEVRVPAGTQDAP